MDYYELIKRQKTKKEALIVDGTSYTYGKLVMMAESLAGRWSAENRNLCKSDKKRPIVHIIKEKDIVTQLVSFLACYVNGEIPLIVPYDNKSFENGQFLDNMEVPENVCMAVSTSGTTGMPKIYFRTYESWAEYFPIQNEIFMINGGVI